MTEDRRASYKETVKQFLRPFKKAIYQTRRSHLARALSGVAPRQCQKDWALVLWSGAEKVRNFDSHFPFRATSDFLYLTGFSEPETLLILKNEGGRLRSLLGVRPRDLSPHRGSEIWEGERVGVERASTLLGCDEAFPIHDALSVLERELSTTRLVYWSLGFDREWDEKIIATLARIDAKNRGLTPIHGILDPRPQIHAMRKIKSPDEVAVMRHVGAIASAGHIRVMKITKPGLFEYQIAAEAEREFRRLGADALAYSSIVGTGNNACTLHYRDNAAELKAGELLLIDAGAEFDGYASDITRTLPVSERFSPAQKEVYSWVLKAQIASIKTVKPGSTFDKAQNASVKILCEGLASMGFFKTSAASIYKRGLWKTYMPHGVGHWLGLDVHDAGLYREPENNKKLTEFVAGNVLTIEPGLYFRDTHKKIPKKYRGIGVRIEDDVLVTRQGFDVLTKNCPKTIHEIESLKGARL